MNAGTRVQLSRAVLAGGAVAGTAITWAAVAQVHPLYGPAAATLFAVVLLWRLRGVFSRRRVVLWLEERAPSLRYSLASLEDAADSPYRLELERVVGGARLRRPLVIAASRLLGFPLLLLLVVQSAVRPLVERVVPGVTATTREAEPLGARGAAGPGRLEVRVTPPAYAARRTESLVNPAGVAALVGSVLRFSGDWSEMVTMPARPTVLRREGPRGTRVVALEPREDSTPRVVLELPARDSVIAAPAGELALVAQARDDIGVASAAFELIVSSGSGESFTFRTAVLGRVNARNARAVRLTAMLPLDSLQLKPGDVMHLRAMARDANPAPDAQAGSSDTRTFRVPRPGENDSASVIPAPPPEFGQSEVSQRMLIMLTERLVARMQRLSTNAVGRETASIARDQGRLRKRVGEIIFARLTGEEHHDEDIDAAVTDTVSPAEALLRAADAATDLELEHSHGDEGPVVGVNRPLLEAFNAMWDAERELNVAAPRRALPHMRAALDAIQRARAAERLYLRGRAPRVVIDEARIRLVGKRADMAPARRSPRASAVAAALERRDRFHRALELLAQGGKDAGNAERERAAVDSLLVLRVDVLDADPELAAALSRAIADLRGGRDATEALLAARRVLNGAPVQGSGVRWGGTW